MAIHTVPWRKDPYPPMRAVLRELRGTGQVDETTINLVYPHVRKALREELDKAVQAERDRKAGPAARTPPALRPGPSCWHTRHVAEPLSPQITAGIARQPALNPVQVV